MSGSIEQIQMIEAKPARKGNWLRRTRNLKKQHVGHLQSCERIKQMDKQPKHLKPRHHVTSRFTFLEKTDQFDRDDVTVMNLKYYDDDWDSWTECDSELEFDLSDHEDDAKFDAFLDKLIGPAACR